MYRIEVAPGEESVFRTIEELAVGIRNGVVTPRARIYHHASQKWLPIGLHPHYKKALEMPAAKAAHAAPKSSTTPLPVRAAGPTRRTDPKSLPPTVEPYPTPRSAPAVERGSGGEPPVIPAPVPSPLVAMQQEVLRDLPVVAIPDPRPLPWSRPAPRAEAPPAEPKPRATPSPEPTWVVLPQRQPQPTVEPWPAPPLSEHEDAGVQPERHPVPRWEHRLGQPEVHPYPAPAAPPQLAVPPRHAEPPLEARHHETARASKHAEPEEALTPRPTARRSRRTSGRPMLLIGVAAALAIGAHLVLTSTPSSSADASEPSGEQPVAPAPAATRNPLPPTPVPERAPAPAAERVPAQRGTTVPAQQVTTAPARVPMVPGPAFAGSAPARGDIRPSDPPRGSPTPPPSAPVPGEPSAEPAIAPPPVAVEVAMPLPPDSLVQSTRSRDTLAMKKILRALNGAQR